MTRSRSFRIHQRNRVINKKKKFIKLANNYWNFEHEGTLDKGKIHCSCSMCRYESTHKELIRKRKQLQELDFEEQMENEDETN